MYVYIFEYTYGNIYCTLCIYFCVNCTFIICLCIKLIKQIRTYYLYTFKKVFARNCWFKFFTVRWLLWIWIRHIKRKHTKISLWTQTFLNRHELSDVLFSIGASLLTSVWVFIIVFLTALKINSRKGLGKCSEVIHDMRSDSEIYKDHEGLGKHKEEKSFILNLHFK